MKAEQIIHKAAQELKSASACPYQESLWILADVLGLSPSAVYLEKESVEAKQKCLFWSKIQERKQGKPLEYILLL